MPANLDESTQIVIVSVACFTTVAIAVPALIGQFHLVPNLKKQLSLQEGNKPSDLFVGILCYFALMSSATIVVTLPVLYLEHHDHDEGTDELFLSSSINFCEEDFRHTPYIAEPANTFSSLTCYVPLALLGLFGPPSREFHRERRFVIMYATLLGIGLGSIALHSLLTAGAQGGDELPMLWYTATAAFIALDVILAQKMTRWREKQERCLAALVLLSAVAATTIYVLQRHHFAIFHIIFSAYTQIMIFSIIWISFGIDWGKRNEQAGIHFKATVLFPLATATGWTAILGLWVWISEMLFCNKIMRDELFGDNVLAPMIWNRVVHPAWHALSGLLAWLLVQVLMAARGMQQEWGKPTLQWFGVPYVVFESRMKKAE